MKIKEDEAIIVREIYDRYAPGDGYRAIAIELNRRGVPSPRPQQGRSAGWDMSSIRSVLHRAIYRGEVIDGKKAKRDADGRRAGLARPAADRLRLPAEHLRIVSPALASHVDARLALNTPHKRGAAGRPVVAKRFLLSGGLCVCWCSAPLEVVRGRQYQCSRHRRKGTCKNGRTYDINDTDAFILEALLNEALDEDMVERLLELSPQEDPLADARRERDSLVKRIQNMEAAIEHAAEVSMVPALVKRMEAAHRELRALMTNGDNGPALMQELRNRIQQAYQWDVLDKPIPRTYGPVK